jgi:hypothetical protein
MEAFIAVILAVCSLTCSSISLSSICRGFINRSVLRLSACKSTSCLRHSSSHRFSSAAMSPTSSWMKSIHVPRGPICWTRPWIDVRSLSRSFGAKELPPDVPAGPAVPVAATAWPFLSVPVFLRRPNRMPPVASFASVVSPGSFSFASKP